MAWGELALRRGETAEAIDRIERGLELTSLDGTIDFYLGSESLATAWQRLGNETQALRVLEDAAQLKARYRNRELTGAFGRFRVQARLAREYRKLGRVQEAEAIEAELLRMLTYADADHPIVRQIRESQGSRPDLSDTAPVTSRTTGRPRTARAALRSTRRLAPGQPHRYSLPAIGNRHHPSRSRLPEDVDRPDLVQAFAVPVGAPGLGADRNAGRL